MAQALIQTFNQDYLQNSQPNPKLGRVLDCLFQSIIEAHGGRIDGRNNQQGKGATFSFTLPIKNETVKVSNDTLVNLEVLFQYPIYY